MSSEPTNSYATSYDDVPYASFPYAQTHIAHLHTIGRLFGLAAPDFRACRVLELGCAGGGNIIPMADEYPNSHFLGIDLSKVQIESGQKIIADLGLKNIELKQLSISDFDAGEKYDFIICHGVFSWVPPEVRESILAICQKNLTPNGLAIISYNTLPGWNMVRSLREMMLYHCERFTDPKEKAAQARALLQFLKESKEGTKSYFTEMIENEMAILARQPDSYLVHEHLEENNQQFYFHEFAAMAARHDLIYLAESLVNQMFLGNYPAKVVEALKASNDLVRVEQYLDFINNRRFRSTILCRKGIALNRNIPIEHIESFLLRGQLKTPENVPADLSGEVPFTGPGGMTFTAKDPATVALGMTLTKNNVKPVGAAELITQMTATYPFITADAARGSLLQNGFRLYFAGGLALHSDAGRFVLEPSDKPCTLPVARLYAHQTNQIPNARHEIITVDPATCCLLRYLDGTRTIDDLQTAMLVHFEKGELHAEKSGERIQNPEEIVPIARHLIQQILPNLAARGLLIG